MAFYKIISYLDFYRIISYMAFLRIIIFMIIMLCLPIHQKTLQNIMIIYESIRPFINNQKLQSGKKQWF